jgi:hypothetical protein
MAIPTNRDEFKEFCLRRLGKPVIEINVDPDQVDDRLDYSLKYYYDYHFDGSEKVYYKHLITDTDIANKYIAIPENIMGVVSIFDIGSSLTAGGFFNIQYQIALNDLYTLTSQSMLPYYMTMQHLNLLQEILVGKQPIRYNRHTNRLHIDMNWNKVKAGQYFVVEAYQVVDPALYADVWSDRWLQRYVTAQIKQQWGSNLTKFTGMQLPGGVQFNGEKLLDEATAEIKDLEQEMIFSYSLPASDMIG